MSLEAIATDETGGVIVQQGRDYSNPSSGIEGIVNKYPETKEAEQAILYLRLWEQRLEHNGQLPKFRNYLIRNKIKPPIIEAYSAHTNLPEQIRAYSAPLLNGDPKKLKVIGIPTDLEARMKQDKGISGLTDEQLMHLYLVHEYMHLALEHESGYKSPLDYVMKEGEVAKLLFRYFKEESKNTPEVFRDYYKPLAKLTALQYISHASEQAKLTGNDSIMQTQDYKDALNELAIPLGFTIIVKTPKYRI